MSKGVSKAKVNIYIDVLMLLLMMAITGVGLLIKYVLVPGFKRNETYGRDTELVFMDMDRHDWGRVHLILGIFLLLLLVLHIVLHFKQVVAIFNRIIVRKPLLKVLGSLLVLISVGLAVFPFFVSPKVIQLQTGISQGSYEEEKVKPVGQAEGSVLEKAVQASETSSDESHHHNEKNSELKDEVELYGYMTLDEVAQEFNVSVKELAEYIHVPVSKRSESLGRLRKKYDFRMGDVKSFILEQRIK